jgi:hypothetical protein
MYSLRGKRNQKTTLTIMAELLENLVQLVSIIYTKVTEWYRSFFDEGVTTMNLNTPPGQEAIVKRPPADQDRPCYIESHLLTDPVRLQSDFTVYSPCHSIVWYFNNTTRSITAGSVQLKKNEAIRDWVQSLPQDQRLKPDERMPDLIDAEDWSLTRSINDMIYRAYTRGHVIAKAIAKRVLGSERGPCALFQTNHAVTRQSASMNSGPFNSNEMKIIDGLDRTDSNKKPTSYIVVVTDRDGTSHKNFPIKMHDRTRWFQLAAYSDSGEIRSAMFAEGVLSHLCLFVDNASSRVEYPWWALTADIRRWHKRGWAAYEEGSPVMSTNTRIRVTANPSPVKGSTSLNFDRTFKLSVANTLRPIVNITNSRDVDEPDDVRDILRKVWTRFTGPFIRMMLGHVTGYHSTFHRNSEDNRIIAHKMWVATAEDVVIEGFAYDRECARLYVDDCQGNALILGSVENSYRYESQKAKTFEICGNTIKEASSMKNYITRVQKVKARLQDVNKTLEGQIGELRNAFSRTLKYLLWQDNGDSTLGHWEFVVFCSQRRELVLYLNAELSAIYTLLSVLRWSLVQTAGSDTERTDLEDAFMQFIGTWRREEIHALGVSDADAFKHARDLPLTWAPRDGDGDTSSEEDDTEPLTQNTIQQEEGWIRVMGARALMRI